MEILLVEDDETFADLFATFFEGESHGFSVTVANTRDEAYKKLEHVQPDAIVLDLHLPVSTGAAAVDPMGGLRLLRAIREHQDERSPYVPIIVISGHDTDEGLIFEYGANDFVRKPVRFSELGHRLRVRLRDAHSRQISASFLEVGPFLLHRTAGEIWLHGRHLRELTRQQKAILAVLVAADGQNVNRERFIGVAPASLPAQITHIRQVIQAALIEQGYPDNDVQLVHDDGFYRLVVGESDSPK